MEPDKRYIITFFKKDPDGELKKGTRVYPALSENWALVKMSAREDVPIREVKEKDQREGYKYIRELK